MRKIALIMSVVLCLCLLGGCSGVKTTPSANGAVAYITIVSDSTVVLSVDKNDKILAATFGIKEEGKNKVAIKKSETIFKDCELVNKTLDAALAEVVKTVIAFNSEKKTSVTIKGSSVEKSADYVSNLKTILSDKLRTVFDENGGESLHFTLSLDEGSDKITLITDSENAN